jgi:ribonuclease P protein component
MVAMAPPTAAAPGHTFPKDRRLRRRADFLRVQSEGRRISTPHFTVLVAAQPGPRPGPARLGIVATRKLGGAVQRNRVKRLCRECFRTWAGFVPAHTDVVVIARGGAHLLSLREVRDEWARAHRKILAQASQALASAENSHHPSGNPRTRGAAKPTPS